MSVTSLHTQGRNPAAVASRSISATGSRKLIWHIVGDISSGSVAPRIKLDNPLDFSGKGDLVVVGVCEAVVSARRTCRCHGSSGYAGRPKKRRAFT